ncbi:MAG: ribosomal RNA small subunit methyltransferase A [Bacilli bacterium]|nr:ribosomal RNA small subunit methyltransferase A [Bacilli bacterium]
MNIKEVKELLERFDAGALKKYGQNFLINEHVLTTIATSLGTANKYVIEIGPGLGSLTRYLVKYYDKVLAYEIDPKMIEVLKNTIFDKLVIKEGDFLKSNIDKDIIEHFDSNDIYMIANLPYYITTPILLKVLEETKKITKIVIMIQKEVADRFLGKPNTKDYNSLSVLIQTFMNVKKVIDVSKNSFYPVPDVDSTVIMLERKEKPDFEILDEDLFLMVNRLLFRQRRKTIVNNLKDTYNKDDILIILNNLGINVLARSESLTIKQIIDISNELSKIGK